MVAAYGEIGKASATILFVLGIFAVPFNSALLLVIRILQSLFIPFPYSTFVH